MVQNGYSILGIMSGTSLDGVDLAYCVFSPTNQYAIVAAQTFAYPEQLQAKLNNVLHLGALDLMQLDVDVALFYADCVNRFLKQKRLPRPKAIASHGHTVFHRPATRLSVQIGRGSHIAVATGIPVVCDFRTTDVANGGQGAPLVPMGDELLFNTYAYCLNLGGFSNVSYSKAGKRLAYDVSPCNLPLNMLCMQHFNCAYDHGGEIGKSGNVINTLLNELNALEYYAQKPPKSLGREWIEKELMPLFIPYDNKRDVIRTYYEHIAIQLAKAISKKNANVLVTGGGAHNAFLMELISQKTSAKIVVPDKQVVDFKEALVFAFLGYLRIHHKPNALKTVTGAVKNSIGGCIYLP